MSHRICSWTSAAHRECAPGPMSVSGQSSFRGHNITVGMVNRKVPVGMLRLRRPEIADMRRS